MGYGMFNISKADIDAHGVDVYPEEANAFLAALPERVAAVEQYGYSRVEVLHNGVWKKLCREDLFRQVATIVTPDNRSCGCHAKPVYGVRINPDNITIIDCLTDG